VQYAERPLLGVSGEVEGSVHGTLLMWLSET